MYDIANAEGSAVYRGLSEAQARKFVDELGFHVISADDPEKNADDPEAAAAEEQQLQQADGTTGDLDVDTVNALSPEKNAGDPEAAAAEEKKPAREQKPKPEKQ